MDMANDVIESKSFFEVFYDLKAPKKIADLFEKVQVTKIILDNAVSTLFVYIESSRLINKENIYKMTNIVKEFVFGTAEDNEVVFVEKYQLSEQYNIQKLTEIYWDSFIFELKNTSKIDYRLIKCADWKVKDNQIFLSFEDNFLSRSRHIKIEKYFQETFLNRFGVNVKINCDYCKEQQNQYRLENEHKLSLQIDQILENVNQNSKPQTEDKTEKQENNQGKRSSQGKAGESNFQQNKENGQKGDFHKKTYSKKASYDPDVFYGDDCEGEGVNISDIIEGIGEICIRGQVIKTDERPIRNNKTIYMFDITDFTDSITAKIFVPDEDFPIIKDSLKKGGFYKIKGSVIYDKYSNELSITSVRGIKAIPDFSTKRADTALEKRVELHMHTVMSDMDSVVDIGKIINRAAQWGHKAIAITDHGVVQAFPIANHAIERLENKDFKILYGVEGYFVDDLKNLVFSTRGQSLNDTFVVFDIETTGLSPKFNTILEIGAVKIRNGQIIDKYSQLINPEVPIPYNIEKLTGIDDSMVLDMPKLQKVLPEFLEFAGDSVLVAHNAEFDTGFIKSYAKKLNLDFDYTIVDTLSLSHILLTEISKFTLDRVCKYLNISLKDHHRALDDAMATGEIFLNFIKRLEKKNISNLDEFETMLDVSPDVIKKSKRYHGIILAKNDIGRVNLYKLISFSHLDYFSKRPLMPKSLINKYREGLIIGSACEAGELFRALLEGADESEIARLVNFYDYLEIQPLGNDSFMIDSDKYPINSVEDIMEINKRIVMLGEEFNKPVCATCDVHFLDPEDEVYRRILMAGKGFKDADKQPPLYFRTTDEMLNEFQYLGSEKAREVVVTNTNLIADMIEKISPVRPDKCPPEIDKSDETLTSICNTKAHEIYGPDLPKPVKARLERELNSIIKNGFAVMYIIAQKLVWKSNDDGYLVGSRGSVGSSFVATMAGITEVNPLPAHYVCPKCYFSDFDSEMVAEYSGRSGCDMPDRNCPVCGNPLDKDGHDIPFETFLGFHGDKEPDIDLNFSGEYQSKAHDYTEELFGKGHAYRAGTIGSIAEKTAYGYVYKYFEEKNIQKRRCEMERIALGCTGVKRTTGQHPGGIIVLPKHEEIYSFTPIQHPANDMTTKTITTHFEYHSIDHNLLKLDILGHDDPTMIRRLEDLTGLDAKTIPLDDEKVMSLFHSTEALGIKPEDISGTELGSLGIPEFGTDFVIQMLKDTKPKSFSDLVRISGLSHGTDVWLGNAQELIKEGKAEISTAICTRDDIMIYLIHMGLEPGMSFKIMESVRKGKGLTTEWINEMEEHGVPEWYIGSCKKIKYMFPKAHAAAYVMMAWRIAYYKVYYPKAYYASYFGIRASAFSYETMCLGKEKLEFHMKEIINMPKEKQTNKDQDSLKDMRLVQEMYARGIEFLPIDLFVADDKLFKIIDGKLMPSLSTIDGLGEKAAAQLKEAAKDGEFLSKEDLRNRAKISKTVIETMENTGIIKDLPETNQLSFNFL